MSTLVICPQGHRWSLASDAATLGDGTLQCPVCGIRFSLDAATVERAATVSAGSAHETGSVKRPVHVPGYEILRELGRGGMGVVYEAQQIGLDRVVALKMILSGSHASETDLARFKTEAEAIARLQHPHIVQVFEVGEYEGLPFLSLEYCSGGSLAKQLRGTPLPPHEAAALVEKLARAMQAAHEANIIHRDQKPGNVLLAGEPGRVSAGSGEPGRVSAGRTPGAYATGLAEAIPKISDFGLAKKLDDVSERTQTGAIVGTPSYMAPEQAAARIADIGPRTDIYALGAILYECLTGRPPFRAATALDTMSQVVSDEPVPPRQLQSRLPVDLETICLKCLRKEAGKRYDSAAALAEDLRRFQAGEPILARPVGRGERAVKWIKRNPTLASTLAVAGVLLLAGTAISTYFALDAAEQARQAGSRPGLIKEDRK